LASVRFGQAGISGYSFEELARELTVSQAYQILALFGVEANVSVIPHLRVVTPWDAELLRNGAAKPSAECGVTQATTARAWAPRSARVTATVTAPSSFSVDLAALRSQIVPAADHGGQARERLLSRFDATLQARGAETERVREWSAEELADALRVTTELNFYLPGVRAAEHQRLFAELERRNHVVPIDVDHLHRTLIGGRRWEEARALAARYPDVTLQRLPDVVLSHAETIGSQPAVWQVDDGGARVERAAVAWPQGPALLIVSDPACGFSRDFMAALSRDPALLASLPATRLFVSPTFGNWGAERLARWNVSHPEFSHVLADRPDPWAAWVPSWETPQLIFLFDGQVIERVNGWPKEGRHDELQAALRKLRALEAAQVTQQQP
jgi:hypothetical protein